MEFIIHLEDNEGKKHNSVRISAQKLIEPTVEALQSKLEEIFGIEPEYQIILFGDMEIHELRGPLTLIGTGKDYKLVLKHSKLENWEAFKMLLDEIKKVSEHNSQPLIPRAFKHLEVLNDSEFFVAYPKFEKEWLYFNNHCAHKLDKEKGLIENAAKVYFSGFYKSNPTNPNIVVSFEKKKVLGTQEGCICKVKKTDPPEAVKMYHVKIHSRVSSRRWGDADIDLREIFVYKLLEEIKIGPIAHFIPNIHNSKYGLYIATEDVPGFKMKCEKPLTAEETSKLNLLEYILMLTDLNGNDKNFGSNENGNLIIVDFHVGMKGMGKYPPREFNKDKYAYYLECWKFPSVFDKVDGVIENQKDFLKKSGIDRNASNMLENYITEIKSNVNQALNANQR